MVRDLFKEYASGENNPDWEYHIERRTPLYTRKNMSVIIHVYFIHLHTGD